MLRSCHDNNAECWTLINTCWLVVYYLFNFIIGRTVNIGRTRAIILQEYYNLYVYKMIIVFDRLYGFER